MAQISERVHIVPMGVEDDRITKAAMEYRAERVILLEYMRPSEKSREIQDRVTKKLDEAGIVYELRTVNFENLFEGIAAFIELVDQHRTNTVRINLATGNKISAVAGMIACATTEAGTPYYVTADRLDSNDPEYAHSKSAMGVQELQDIPLYPMDRPTDEQLQLMYLISDAETSLRDTEEPFLTKGKLLEEARALRLPFLLDEDGEPPDDNHAGYNRLRRHIINPLKQKDLIQQEDQGTSTRVKLTESGESVLTAFLPLIE